MKRARKAGGKKDDGSTPCVKKPKRDIRIFFIGRCVFFSRKTVRFFCLFYSFEVGPPRFLLAAQGSKDVGGGDDSGDGAGGGNGDEDGGGLSRVASV